MSKNPKDMTDQELLDSWNKGSKWLKTKMQVTGTTKAEDGQPYDHTTFTGGLERIAELEDELIKRKIKYGQDAY